MYPICKKEMTWQSDSAAENVIADYILQTIWTTEPKVGDLIGSL